jgi:hypothetical protein
MNWRIVAAVVVTLTQSAPIASALMQPSVADRGTQIDRNALAATPTVSPPSGTAHTTFVIRFTSGAKLGRHRGFALEYDLDTFEGNRHPTVGCEGSFGDVIHRGSSGEHLVFRERPATQAGWCPSRYRGTIRLIATYPCRSRPSRFTCNPQTKALVGQVSWRVRRG